MKEESFSRFTDCMAGNLRSPRPREVRAFFSCLSWRAIPSPLSKLKIRLESLEATQRALRDPRRGSREATLQLDMEQQTGSKMRKECITLLI